MLERAPFLALFFVLPGALSGCFLGQSCTELGCGGTVIVNFKGAVSVPGDYLVTLVVDGAKASCSLALPYSCEPDAELECDVPSMSRGWSAHVGQGCKSLSDVYISGSPRSVDVLVERDGVVVADAHLEPAYSSSWPNGPDCGECSSAPPLDVVVE